MSSIEDHAAAAVAAPLLRLDGLTKCFGVQRVLSGVSMALQRREIPGGPGPRMVARQLVRASTLVAKTRRIAIVMARQPAAAKEVGAEVRPRAQGREAPESRHRPGKSRS